MNTTQVDIHELPLRFPELISLAASGTEIVVTQSDVPRAKLIPIVPPKARVLGLHPGTITTSDDFDAPLPDDFWVNGL